MNEDYIVPTKILANSKDQHKPERKRLNSKNYIVQDGSDIDDAKQALGASVTKCLTEENQRQSLDDKLEELVKEINPQKFPQNQSQTKFHPQTPAAQNPAKMSKPAKAQGN